MNKLEIFYQFFKFTILLYIILAYVVSSHFFSPCRPALKQAHVQRPIATALKKYAYKTPNHNATMLTC